jgi:GT2 family glycosyltransferase
MSETTVVIASRNRRRRLVESVAALRGLPERPPVIVVDNGSTDGSAGAVSDRFPGVTVIRLPRNLGAPARNAGVEAAATPLVAFADDDSGWRPGALRRAERAFASHPRLALVAAAILVGADERLDPVCAEMAAAPYGIETDMPGPTVTGFLAFAAIVRRDAFLAAGGFDDVVFFMGEEERLAYDLIRGGWGLAYCDDIGAMHHPAADPAWAAARKVLACRNHALTCWMRRPMPMAVAATARLGAAAVRARDRSQVGQFAWRLPRALARRRRPAADVEALLADAQHPAAASTARR